MIHLYKKVCHRELKNVSQKLKLPARKKGGWRFLGVEQQKGIFRQKGIPFCASSCIYCVLCVLLYILCVYAYTLREYIHPAMPRRVGHRAPGANAPKSPGAAAAGARPRRAASLLGLTRMEESTPSKVQSFSGRPVWHRALGRSKPRVGPAQEQ